MQSIISDDFVAGFPDRKRMRKLLQALHLWKESLWQWHPRSGTPSSFLSREAGMFSPDLVCKILPPPKGVKFNCLSLCHWIGELRSELYHGIAGPWNSRRQLFSRKWVSGILQDALEEATSFRNMACRAWPVTDRPWGVSSHSMSVADLLTLSNKAKITLYTPIPRLMKIYF